jgi:hypothetical protein
MGSKVMNVLSLTQDLMLNRLEVTSMVSDNLLRDVEPCYYLVKNEKIRCVSIIVKCWHSLDPLCEVVYRYNDVMMPLVEAG